MLDGNSSLTGAYGGTASASAIRDRLERPFTGPIRTPSSGEEVFFLTPIYYYLNHLLSGLACIGKGACSQRS